MQVVPCAYVAGGMSTFTSDMRLVLCIIFVIPEFFVLNVLFRSAPIII
jgi:hypothetical protein